MILESVFFTHEPRIATWYDCRGSVGKYVGALNEKSTGKIRMADELNALLNNGEKIELNDHQKNLMSFLNIFSKGTFIISTWDLNNSETEYALDHVNYTRFNNVDFVFPLQIDKQKEEYHLNDYKAYMSESLLKNGYVTRNIINFTTSGFYDFCNECLIMTQSLEDIDRARVKYYKDLISTGKKALYFGVQSRHDL